MTDNENRKGSTRPMKRHRSPVVDEELAERRRANVARLAEIVGTNKAAAAIGWSNAYFSAIKNPDRSNSRSIGDGPARQIEVAFDLPAGALDIDHPMDSRVMPSAVYEIVGYMILANDDELDVVADLVKAIIRARLKRRIPSTTG